MRPFLSLSLSLSSASQSPLPLRGIHPLQVESFGNLNVLCLQPFDPVPNAP
jgi:hypothetical protein